MTTIAYKDGVIAYDSRLTSGDLVESDDFNKRLSHNGVQFILSGSVSDYERFVNLYFDNTIDHKKLNIIGLILDKGKLYCASVNDDDGFWKYEHDLKMPISIGSGHTFAFTAMDCGLSAKDAVKMAIKRDSKSGGKVRTYKL